MNNTATGMKNMLEGVNYSVVKAEEWISKLEDKTVEIAAMKQNKENRNEDRNWQIWKTDVWLPKGKRRGGGGINQELGINTYTKK